MKRDMLWIMVLGVWTLGLFGSACTKKQKSYTLESVNAELAKSQKQIVKLRKKGKLEQSASLALDTGNKILKVYPVSTMYRENVSKIVSVMGFVARICTDKALHIRNESMKPKESQKYTKLSDDLYAMVDEIRRKMPSMPSNKKPEIKKVTPNSGEEDAEEASSKGGADAEVSGDESEK